MALSTAERVGRYRAKKEQAYWAVLAATLARLQEAAEA